MDGRRVQWVISGIIAIQCFMLPNLGIAEQIAPVPLLVSYYLNWNDDPVAGQKKKNSDEDELGFLETDIKDLGRVLVRSPMMDVEVTSVSKQPSTVGRSAAAVFVITQEMIRRSGATSLPEILRMVPGVCVSRYNSHGWSVSMRGPHLQYSREVLLLIDGRTIYDTLYAGVYWDTQDLVLEDIERIEVIRGPGGSLWGANAVTGVISITTKKAQETQGTLITTGGGNLDNTLSQFRVGSSNGEGLAWRVWGKHFDRGCEYLATGAHDDWRIGRGGFRVDWEPDRCRKQCLTVLGNYYGGTEGNEWLMTTPVAPPYYQQAITSDPVSGANVLARWEDRFDEESGYSVQMYFDRAYRNEYILGHMQTSFDVELEHHFTLGQFHHLVWGLRSIQTHTDILRETFYDSMSLGEDTFRMFSGFIQDQIPLVEDKLTFTIGTKLENNSYTGFEFQPSARLLWVLDDRRVVWGAVSRAVRLPAYAERYVVSNVLYGGYVPGPVPGPLFLRLYGNDRTEAETMIAYEIGYRAQPTDRFSWDLNLYLNAYENLIGTTNGSMDYDPVNACYYVPSVMGNVGRGQGYGLELSGQWEVNDNWRLFAWYNLSCLCFTAPLGSDTYVLLNERSVPRNQAQLRSQWNLGGGLAFDAALRYVDSIKMDNFVPSYITMDLRLGWQASENFELALVGTNLLENHHAEFPIVPIMPVTTEVRRTVYTQLVWRH